MSVIPQKYNIIDLIKREMKVLSNLLQLSGKFCYHGDELLRLVRVIVGLTSWSP